VVYDSDSNGSFITLLKGAMWELDEFVELMSAPPPGGTGSNLDRLWSHVRRLRGSDNLEDDFSILEVDFE
jgi:hypothetical protein